jgi:Ca2+-binding EF-hand superfamily protein
MNVPRKIVFAIVGVAAMIGAGPSSFARAGSDPLRGLDTDRDGTIDLTEARNAASAMFNRLDPDHDGTLDLREVHRQLTAKEVAAADPDHDGTLTKDEYVALCDQRFKVADLDHDGTLDAKELQTRAGRAFLKMVK